MVKSSDSSEPENPSWVAWLGMGLFWSWLWVVLIKPSGISLEFDTTSPFLSYRIISLAGAFVGTGASLVLPAVRGGAWRHVMEGNRLRFGIVAVYALVMLVSFLPTYNPLVQQPIEAFLAGVVVAVLFVGWGVELASYEGARAVKSVVVSLAIAMAISIVMFLLDFSKQDLMVLLLPVLSATVLFTPAFRGRGQATSPAADDGSGCPVDEFAPAIKGSTLHKLSITVLIQGIAIGVWHFLFQIIVFEKCPAEFCIYRELNRIFTTHGLDDFIGFASLAGFALAILLVFLTVNVLHMNFRSLVYQVGLPFMALGFIVITLNQGIVLQNGTHMTGDVFVRGETLHVAGYFYALVIILVLCSYLVRNGGAQAPRLISGVGFFLISGQLVGYVSANILNAAGTSGSDLCLITVFVLLFGGLAIMGADVSRSDWGDAAPDVAAERQGAFRTSCKEIAVEANLTQREAEVFTLLAKGRNLRFIEKELFISRDTVKSHLKKIYRKLDIHSQQELINLVEQRSKTNRRGM